MHKSLNEICEKIDYFIAHLVIYNSIVTNPLSNTSSTYTLQSLAKNQNCWIIVKVCSNECILYTRI